MAEKKKILYIVEAMGGGIFTYLVQLAGGLCHEFDITIAFGLRKETPDNYREFFDQSVNLIQVKSFARSVNPLKDIRAGKELLKIVKEVKPDIVHLHSSKAGVLGRLLISGKKYRLFYTPHGYSFLMEDVPRWKKSLYWQIEKICGRRNCITVACGKSEWEKSLKVTKKSTYISNGIDTEKLDRIVGDKNEGQDVLEADIAKENVAYSLRQNDMPKGTKHNFTVYTLGRISYQKNPEMFNEIAGLVPEVSFLWIGDGDMREVLTETNISVTGWKTSEEALSLAQAGDVFILPSRWEGLPISLLEAMYMKKPCLVSDVVGNRDVIRHERTGFICKSAQDFAAVIRTLKEQQDSDMYQQVTELAQKEILENYNGNTFCEKYKKIYETN